MTTIKGEKTLSFVILNQVKTQKCVAYNQYYPNTKLTKKELAKFEAHIDTIKNLKHAVTRNKKV